MTVLPSFLSVGTVLQGKYRITRYIASGGFGNTYLAWHVDLEQNVVIKEFFMRGVNERGSDRTTVNVSNSDNELLFSQQRQKFKKEAQRIFMLHNDHIVRVLDFFDANNTSYYVMEFIDGESLAARMKRLGGTLPEAQALDIVAQVLDALKTIHAERLWHMDLKPANIMIDQSGRCRLIDFGSSKQTDPSGGNTSTTMTYTPGYAPSEQVNNAKALWGPWTDLYALGATLYNLISRNQPPLDVDINVKGDSAFFYPQPVSDRTKFLIRWLMQPVYTQRPQSADDVMAYLIGNVRKGRGNSRKWLWGLVGFLAVLAVVGVILLALPKKHVNDIPQDIIEQTDGSSSQTFTVRGVSFTMMPVEGGTFWMGAADDDEEAYTNECPAHEVTLDSYMIGETEVTQALWQAVMGDNPSEFTGDLQRPVEQVSWDDCQTFVLKLNDLTSSQRPSGMRFRLPTEAEWEYAARGGNKGKDNNYKYSGSNIIGDVAWYWRNSGDEYLSGTDDDWDVDKRVANNCKTHAVKTKTPNELGLYDMSGNVWEWCSDMYDDYKNGSQTTPNPQTTSRSFSDRVLRGGSFLENSKGCRVSYRGCTYPDQGHNIIGFRLVLS